MAALRAAERAGRRPSMLANEIELSPWQAFALRCWYEAGTCRQLGPVGPGPLPWDAVRAWASEHGIFDPDEFDDLLYLVTKCDGVYLDHVRKEAGKSLEGRKR